MFTGVKALADEQWNGCVHLLSTMSFYPLSYSSDNSSYTVTFRSRIQYVRPVDVRVLRGEDALFLIKDWRQYWQKKSPWSAAHGGRREKNFKPWITLLFSYTLFYVSHVEGKCHQDRYFKEQLSLTALELFCSSLFQFIDRFLIEPAYILW